MGGEHMELSSEAKERIIGLFTEVMTRLAKFEELADVGSKLISGYRQGLEFLCRPPIKKSDLVEKIIKANETKGVKSYFGEQQKCVNTRDAVENINKLNSCYCGLQDHLTKANAIVDELKMLVDNTTTAMQYADETGMVLYEDSTDFSDEAAISSHHEDPKSEPREYALTMAIIYSMVKQEYSMQEKIVTALNFKVSTEELESYCFMWSLRPNINDDIARMAWMLIR